MRRVLLCALLLCGFLTCAEVLQAQTPVPADHIRIHYHRSDGAYAGWTVYAFGDTTEDQGNFGGGPVQVSGTDSFGAYFDVGITAGAANVGIIVHMGNTKDPGPDETVDPATQGNEFWQLSGVTGLTTTKPALPGTHFNPNIPANTARIHFYRPDGVYTNWYTYAFNDTTADTGNYNGGPIPVTGTDAYGVYYDVPLKPNPSDIGFIVHNIVTGAKNTPNDNHLNVAAYNEAWVISGDPAVYLMQPTAQELLNANFLKLQAFWIDRSTVLMQTAYLQSGGTYNLVSAFKAGLQVGAKGVTGGNALPLSVGGALTAEQAARFPQLTSGYTVLHLPANTKANVLQFFLQGQLGISVQKADGTLGYATGVQDAGVLDDLYAYSGKLGVITHNPGSVDDDATANADPEDASAPLRLKLWAPTAQIVKLQLFTNETDTTPASVTVMQPKNGVWSLTVDPKWIGHYYLYDVRVYAPSVRSVVDNIVTDPYSIDLALNGTKSRITDVDAATNKPAGWDESRAPQLARLNDLSIYELHVRDFSVGDATVPAAHQGTYLAFTDANSDGMKHLSTLAASGLKAIHLLPTFHFNSVNEDKSTWQTTGDLSGYPPDGQQQQAAVTAVQGADAYNWGYDPDHYLAPEGAYAVNPDERVKEYRQMVMGLHNAGLRVIQDVVFNHTSGFGEASNSILDEVVPDYYNRLDADGALLTASCCADTATEHLMMGKLQQDAVVWNAKKYKIDGFRFDIMSFTFVSNLQGIRNAFAKLTLAKDGIDGSKIYIYGEGFNFGETANSALGLNASQLNLYGYGFGTFNDRIRDGVRGGGPFDDERVQGFATGLFTDPSAYTQGNTMLADQKATLLHRSDWIRVGLTGNLRDYSFIDATGMATTGGKLDYQGQPTGYTATPIEAVNYASVHDNQDLFDIVQIKSSAADDIATRTRRAMLANSLIELGQAVPFFQGADDLLRSKDMDQNSYDSGDWFNKIDWTGQGNNWGIGLPIASQNASQWSFQQPLLANAALKPSAAQIGLATQVFQEFLRIRASSGLFRMATFDEVQRNLHFLNTGTSQIPGVIVMELDANGGNYGPWQHAVVVFNGTNTQQSLAEASLANMQLELDPLQQNSADAVVQKASFARSSGTLNVPPLTTAVFVAAQ